jgi:hypothetical protein
MLKCSGFPNVRCSCGGAIHSDGDGYIQLPIGFGFSEGGQFVVDVVRYPAYHGFCDRCKKEGMFARTDRKPKAIRTKPRKLNQKIRAVN